MRTVNDTVRMNTAMVQSVINVIFDAVLLPIYSSIFSVKDGLQTKPLAAEPRARSYEDLIRHDAFISGSTSLKVARDSSINGQLPEPGYGMLLGYMCRYLRSALMFQLKQRNIM
jgi:hypothetical protein